MRAPGSIRPPPDGLVRVEHYTHTNRNDEIERPADEAVRLFWRFVREKFGLAMRKPSAVFGPPVAASSTATVAFVGGRPAPEGRPARVVCNERTGCAITGRPSDTY